MPADEGRVTVVMDTVDYKTKCEDHLNQQNVYKKVQQNPTKSFKTKVNKMLKEI